MSWWWPRYNYNYYKEVEGGTAFYPFGVLGRGYIVDAGKRKRIDKIIYAYFLPGLTLLAVATYAIFRSSFEETFLNVLLFLALFVIPPLLVYWIVMKVLLEGCARTSERITWAEIKRDPDSRW